VVGVNVMRPVVPGERDRDRRQHGVGRPDALSNVTSCNEKTRSTVFFTGTTPTHKPSIGSESHRSTAVPDPRGPHRPRGSFFYCTGDWNPPVPFDRGEFPSMSRLEAFHANSLGAWGSAMGVTGRRSPAIHVSWNLRVSLYSQYEQRVREDST
jgi:hypothetical protein